MVQRCISCDSSYGRSPSVKHMVLSTSKGANPFCGLTVMKSSDYSITEKDFKASVINSDKCVFLADVFIWSMSYWGVGLGSPWQQRWLHVAEMRRCSGEGTIPDQTKILEVPQDNPIIPAWLSKSWLCYEYSWDSLRVHPIYKVVTLFLAK